MSMVKSARILRLIAGVSTLLAMASCGGSSSHSFIPPSGPVITTQPVGPSISSGHSATLTVGATGSGTLSYQWFQGPSGATSNPISGATSSSYPTPDLTATTSYWVQVSDSNGSTNSNTAVVLIAGPRAVQALLFSLATQPPPASFIANVLPNITGVSVGVQWSQVESSNASGTGSGGYDFTSVDASLQPYLASGRKVNLIIWPATEGGDNDPNNGGSTPAYVFSQGWANDPTVKAPNPQDMAVCGSYTGDSGNPYYSAASSGGGGSWNTSISGDLSGLPVSYEAPFMVAYQNFIKAVIAHYNLSNSPAIGYIRFGFSQGGEDSPECNQYWGPPNVPNYSASTYLNYIQTMTNFVHAQNPSMTILADLHAVGPPGDVDYSYADSEASYAEADHFGVGTNGLQQSDITQFEHNLPCDSDWCNLFTPAGGFSYNPTLSLQTLQWSDPTNVVETGSLAPVGIFPGLIPFAQAHAVNNLELYLADLAIAFDPNNYCQYPHSTCPTINASTYSSAYTTVIQDFLEP
jgi:hypothetical protein